MAAVTLGVTQRERLERIQRELRHDGPADPAACRRIFRDIAYNSAMEITGKQIRAARSALDWTVAHLAGVADVGISTIQTVEKHDGVPEVDASRQWRQDARAESLRKIRTAFESAGIRFTKNGIAWD